MNLFPVKNAKASHASPSERMLTQYERRRQSISIQQKEVAGRGKKNSMQTKVMAYSYVRMYGEYAIEQSTFSEEARDIAAEHIDERLGTIKPRRKPSSPDSMRL